MSVQKGKTQGCREICTNQIVTFWLKVCVLVAFLVDIYKDLSLLALMHNICTSVLTDNHVRRPLLVLGSTNIFAETSW